MKIIFRRPFPFSCQMDSSDCDAACLRMIAKSYGRDYSLNILREYSHISRGGASLMGVCDAAEEIGFHATGVKATLHLLREKVPLPCILHWKQNHYVVLYRIRKRRRGYLYHIADPSSSLIVLTEEEFGANWFSSIKNGNECGNRPCFTAHGKILSTREWCRHWPTLWNKFFFQIPSSV